MSRRSLPLLVLALLLLPSGPSFAGEEGAGSGRGYVGFHAEPLTILSPEQRRELGVDVDVGTAVSLVLPDGPADRAGLRKGDLLLRFAGRDVPMLETRDRYEPVHHEWRVAMREMFEAVRANVEVPVVVRRGGAEIRLTLHPVDETTMHHMQGGTDTPPPRPAPDAAALRMQELFEAPDGALPTGFFPYEGRWRVVEAAGAASGGRALRQDLPVLPWSALLVTGEGRTYADGHAQVRFKPLSGVTDASGGVIWRAQDGVNYYLVRANALEDNFQIYVMRDGVRTTLSTVVVEPPAFDQWHVIDVWFRGPHFRATLDGKDVVEATDATWSSGFCGLWTKADSVTLFDDLEVTPSAQGPM